MRNLLVAPILVLILFCLSCSVEEEGGSTENSEDTGDQVPEKEEGQEEENISTVNFSFGGEFANNKGVSKNVETEDNDLFGIQFYEVETKKPYGYVLGDDISQVTMDFRTGHPYMMKMTYLKNAKDILYSYEEKWGEPFNISGHNTAVLNQAYYSSSVRLEKISAPYLNLKNVDGGLYVEEDRYHEVIESFKILREQEDLAINLKRLVFGLTLNVESEDIDLDILYLSINAKHNKPREYSLALTEGKGSLEIPYITLGFPNLDPFEKYLNKLDRAVLGEYQERVHISIGTPDKYTRYFDDYITVKRNRMMVVDLSPEEDEESSNHSFNINFEEGMLNTDIDLLDQ